LAHGNPNRFSRLLVAFVIAMALWWIVSPIYDRLVTAATGGMLSVTETSAVTRLERSGDSIRIFRGGLRGENGGSLKMRYLTFNFIIFLTLAFAFVSRPAKRFLGRLGLGALAMFVVHLVATWVAVKTIILMTASAQGRAEIGLTENILFVLYQGYSVVGAAAIAFALWWIVLRPASDGDAVTVTGDRRL
jgi:hypothetical protein